MKADVFFTQFQQIIEEKIPFHRILGIRLLSAEPGKVSIHWESTDDYIGDFRKGYIHGGIIAALMDIAGGAAAMSTMNSLAELLATVDMRVDYLEPARKGTIIVNGEVVRSGQTIIATTMKAHQPDHQRLIATGQAVFYARRLQ